MVDPSDPRYIAWRKRIEETHSEMALVPENRQTTVSPSGRYFLVMDIYSSGPRAWEYSRATVLNRESGKAIADIVRNYGMFWYAWVQNHTGEYLLCGEDYQGYNVIDLTRGENYLSFPEEAFEGGGFCWAAVHPSPSGNYIAVEGCYWACPYELRVFDFRDPHIIPLPQLFRAEELEVFGGWVGDSEFTFTVETENGIERRAWAAKSEA